MCPKRIKNKSQKNVKVLKQNKNQYVDKLRYWKTIYEKYLCSYNYYL